MVGARRGETVDVEQVLHGDELALHDPFEVVGVVESLRLLDGDAGLEHPQIHVWITGE